MNRRMFLKLGGALSAASVLPIARYAWAAKNPEANGKRLVVVFLRGAIDGLSVLVPYNESLYYDLRPSIAVKEGKGEDRAQDLDGRFALHPALAALLPLWREGSLAFVQCAGSPDDSRSHFDAQDYMESGTPGVKTTADGWMNRLLQALPGARSPTRALSFGPVLPRIVKGEYPVTNIPMGKSAARPVPLDRPMISGFFDRMYQGDDALARAYREGQTARREILAELAADMEASSNGAPPARGLAQAAEQAARLIARDRTAQLAFLAAGGWDTHVNQGAAQGQLANRLRALAEALMGLARGLGGAYRDTVIVVMSEFGRTVRENGNGGTDHGHGNAMWLMGGPVRGGKIYGDWPGLASEQLFEARDLVVSTDFRDVCARVLTAHLGMGDEALAAVFPAYRPKGAHISDMIA